MTAIPSNKDNPRQIPQRLIEPLKIVAGRARLLGTLRAVFQLAALCAVVWLGVVMILGSSVRVAPWIALPLAVVAWGAVIGGGYWILRPLFRRRRDLAAAAWLVDQAAPETQERISSAIEITQEKEAAFRGSPELVACLIRQAEHHADTVDPHKLVSGKEVMKWFGAVALMLLIWFILLVVMMPNVLLGLERLVHPWSAAAALPEPLLKIEPGDQTLAQGQDAAVSLEVDPPQGLSLDNGNEQIAHAAITRHFVSPGKGAASAIPDITEEMQRTGNRSFAAHFDNVQQSFTYRVVVDGGEKIGRAQSPDYTVTVQTLPFVADLEVQYTYPAYTRLQPRTDHAREGAIDGVAGTNVRVVIHPSEPVRTAVLTIDDAGSGAKVIAMTPETPADSKGAAATQPAAAAYAAEFTLVKSSHYHIALATATGRDNPDNQSRAIVVRPDRAPDMVILSPDPKNPLKVRRDDKVPVHFMASDDFGISGAEARVRVDDRPVLTLPVALASHDAQVEGDWTMDVAAVLRSAAGAGEAHRVICELVSLDNRDPNPQSSAPARLTLDLDDASAPLAQRLDAAAARDLAAAVKDAGDKLKQAQAELEALKKADTAAHLADAPAAQAAAADRDLSAAREALNRAADQADPTRLNEAGKKLRDVAENEVQRAQEQTVKTQLATDQPDQRQANTAGAAQNVQQALDKLDQLAGTLKETQQAQPLAQALEKLADEQRQLADALAQNPNDPKLLARQKELQQQLEQLIKENPQLQQPVADANQAKLNALAQKLRDIDQAQAPLAQQLNNANSAAQSADKAKELARQQEQLNKDVQQFSQQQGAALKQAGTPAPDAAKLDPIVKELQDEKLTRAESDQKTAANQLDQAAGKLESAQKQLESAPRQKAAEQAAKDAQDASDLQRRTNELAQEIRKAKSSGNPPSRFSDPANEHARALADDIKRAAQQLSQTPAGRPAAQNAGKLADTAKGQASQAHAEAAQQQLAQAASQLAQAAQAEQKAAGVPAGSPGGEQPGQAAEKARALAEKQRALADETGQLNQAQEDAAAARNNAAGIAQKQQALADRIEQAEKEAQQLQQQTQGGAPEMAQRAGRAAQSLQQAAAAQQDAARAAQSADAQKSAAQQNQSGDKVSDAHEALTGQRLAHGGPGSPPPAANPSRSASASDSQNQGGNNPSPPSSNGGSASTPSPSAGSPSTPGTPGSGMPGSGMPGAGSAGTASAGSAGQSGQGGAAGQGGSQGQGGAAGQSRSAGQGGSPGQSGSPSGGGAQGTASAGPSPGGASGNSNSGSSSSGNSTAGNLAGGSAAGSGTGMTGAESQAAQAVQGARDSQSQAAGGNPTAARNAADQLAQAARQLTPGAGQNSDGSTPSGTASAGSATGAGAAGTASPGAPSGQSGQSGAGGAPGAGQGMPGGSASSGGTASPGAPGGSGTAATPGGGGGGVKLTYSDRPADMPKEVRDVGISPSDWARLPPQTQEQLLHSAQQPGPPGYRDLIKSYYSRIARIPPPPAAPPETGAPK